MTMLHLQQLYSLLPHVDVLDLLSQLREYLQLIALSTNNNKKSGLRKKMNDGEPLDPLNVIRADHIPAVILAIYNKRYQLDKKNANGKASKIKSIDDDYRFSLDRVKFITLWNEATAIAAEKSIDAKTLAYWVAKSQPRPASPTFFREGIHAKGNYILHYIIEF